MLLLVIRHSHISLAEGRQADLSGQSSGVRVKEGAAEVGVLKPAYLYIYLSDGPAWWATTTHCASGGLFKLLLEQSV